MFAQPQAEGVLGDAGDERAGLPGGQALLRLAAELGLGQLRREHVGAALPDVLGGDLQALRQQVAELAVLAQRIEQAAAQTVHVGAAERRGNEVDVALGDDFAALGQPLQGPLGAFQIAFGLVVERRGGHALAVAEGLAQIAAQAGLEAPFFRLQLFRGFFDRQGHRKPRAQHRLGAKQMPQPWQRQLGGVEIALVRQEVDAGAGVAAAHGVHRF